MADKIKAYMNRRNIYTLIEKWAEEGEEFFYADNIKDNVELAEMLYDIILKANT